MQVNEQQVLATIESNVTTKVFNKHRERFTADVHYAVLLLGLGVYLKNYEAGRHDYERRHAKLCANTDGISHSVQRLDATSNFIQQSIYKALADLRVLD